MFPARWSSCNRRRAASTCSGCASSARSVLASAASQKAACVRLLRASR